MTKDKNGAMQADAHASETQGNGDEKQSREIRGRGGKRPGAGRPAGSPNKLTRPLREAAALEGEACLETLIQLRDHGESEQVRLAAASAILDRGFGRPRQEFGIKDESVTVIIDRAPVPIDGRPAINDGTREFLGT